MKPKDRIKLGDLDVTSKYDKEKQKEYINFLIFSFDKTDGFGGNKTNNDSEPHVDNGEVEDDCPFF